MTEAEMLDFLEQNRLSVAPQIGGGWVIERSDGDEAIEVYRGRNSLRTAIVTAAKLHAAVSE